MATIGDDKKSIAQKAADSRAPFDGPHKPGAQKKPAPSASAGTDSGPSYVVVVTKHEKTSEDDPSREVQHKYDPKELRAKARAFLGSGNISPQEKEVLEKILGNDQESPKPGRS